MLRARQPVRNAIIAGLTRNLNTYTPYVGAVLAPSSPFGFDVPLPIPHTIFQRN